MMTTMASARMDIHAANEISANNSMTISPLSNHQDRGL
jgi:hypothetical protein